MILNTSQGVYHAPLDHRTQIPTTAACAAWWWRTSGQPPRWTEESGGKNDGKNQPWILRHSSINISRNEILEELCFFLSKYL